MAALQQTFSSSPTWAMAHTWGAIHPYTTVVDTTGNTLLVAPTYTNNLVTLEFSRPYAGTMTIIGPDDGGGGGVTLPAPSASLCTPPFENAVLVEVRGPGLPDRSGKITVLGDAWWYGQATGYLRIRPKTVVSGGQQLHIKTNELFLRDLTGVPVQVEAGAAWEAATVLIDDLGTGSTVRRRFEVKACEHRTAGSDVDSVRLELAREVPV